MKNILFGTLFLMSLGITTSVQAAQFFRANINGLNIVPNPTNSEATGVANLRLNDDQTALSYEIILDGLNLDNTPNGTVNKIHFHLGASHESSPFHILNIYGPEDDDQAIFNNSIDHIIVRGIWDNSDACVDINCNTDPDTTKALSDYLDELLAHQIYVNIHTTDFPSGEIRGQIVSVPESSTLLGLIGISGLIILGLRNQHKQN